MRVVPFEDLTPEQQALAAAPTTRHLAAVGAPGSGKTLVLVHRAIRLVEQGLPSPKILIVTYTNTLESYIRAGLLAAGLPESMVISYDALMRNLHQQIAGASFKRPDKTSDDDHFNGQRDAVHQLLVDEIQTAMFTVDHRWDVILVDETQDLSAQDVHTLTMLGRHVTAVLDSRQQLYRRGGDAQDICQALGLRWETVSLVTNFRCSESVLRVAARAADSQVDQDFLPATVGRAMEEIPSLRVLARDRDEEDIFLHEAIKSRASRGLSCAVLVPTKFFAHGIAKALTDAGFAVEGPDAKKVDLASGAIKVLTYHGAKGLSFNSVFLPRLWESQLRTVAKHTRRGSLLFVALTRATTYLFLSATQGFEAREWKEFDVVDDKYLETVIAGGHAAGKPKLGQEHQNGPQPTAEDALGDYI